MNKLMPYGRRKRVGQRCGGQLAMSFLTTINEALKSEREPDEAKKIEIKVPQLDRDKWLANQKEGRESKFKRLPDDHIISDSPDTFFFNYNPGDNILFTSNGSFSFIIDRKPRWEYKKYHTAPFYHDLKKVTDDQYSENKLNFRVDKRTKKIHLEKQWQFLERSSKIVPGKISKPDQVKDALRAAIKHYPELANYTFVPTKQKAKEYAESSLESGGAMKAYFSTLGDEMKKVLQDGLDRNTVANSINKNIPVGIYFDKKESVADIKTDRDPDRLYHVIATSSFTFSDPDLLEEGSFDSYKIKEGKSVPAEDIKLENTNFKKYFDKGWTPATSLTNIEKNLLDNWGMKWHHIFIAKDDEEYEYFRRRQLPEKYTKAKRQLKGSKNIWKWENEYKDKPNAIGLRLKEGTLIIMFAPGTTEREVNEFLARRWWEARHLFRKLEWDLRRVEGIQDAGYDIYFNHKFLEPLGYELIKLAFSEASSYLQPAEDMLKALGREVYKANED